MYTLAECEKFWEEAGQHGSPPERVERAKTWLPYYTWLVEQQKKMPVTSEAEADGFPSLLLREGMIHPEDTVLDIGAGPGSASLFFAANCRSVMALDMSEASLALLSERAEKRGLSNLIPVQAAWEEFHTEQPFDVTYSSMCPAICNPEELRRLERITRRRCCLVTVMRGSYDKHRKAMMKELDIHPKGGMLTEPIHYFNVLYLMGRRPAVFCRTETHAYDVTEEIFLTQYSVYFKIFGVSEEHSLPFLRDYYSRHAEDGVLHDESRLHYTLITWTVN